MNFEEIYNQYSPKIFRVCLGYTSDRELAGDLTQETFISVWQNLEKFRDKSNIGTWIFRIATNNCLRSLEKQKRLPKSELHPEMPAVPEENKELKLDLLQKFIAELEETDRIIISLVLEDLSQQEIAEITGLSHGNIRVKVHRIKEKLSLKFKKHGQF
jgi:RNA polymerase sigma-70 factor, ECF subfamily